MSKAISKLNRGISLAGLVLQGFKYQSAKQYLRLKKKHPHPQQLKTIMRMLPFNNAYDKLTNDILSTQMVLTERSDCFATPYALLMELDGQKQICTLPTSPAGITKETESLIALLRDKGAVLVRDAENQYPLRFQVWRYAAGQYFIDREAVSEQELHRAAEALPSNTLLCEYAAPAAGFGCAYPVLHLMLVKTDSGGFTEAKAYISDVTAIDGEPCAALPAEDARVAAGRALAAYVSRKFYELPYMHFSMLLTADGFVLLQLDSGRDLAYLKNLPDEVTQMLERMVRNRPRLTWRRKKEQLYKYITSWQAKRKGFIDFMYRNWLRGLREDNQVRCTTRQEKRWAHRRGFYSYRIKQYGLTEENYRSILSDYDYKWLRPLNCRYHKWLWDKLMAYYVLAPFRAYMPAYYYRIIPENGKPAVISYDTDCQRGEVADVVALLRQKGKLALKPAVGSHGEGFCKLAYEQGAFFVNNKERTEEEVLALLNGLTSTYIVSEYIEMHHALQRIYDKVACTVRVMTIRDGAPSPIKNAYFRIGTSFTGNTDNLGSGGIAAPVEPETGRFGNAELLAEHEFRPCPTHPDTGVPVEGTLPHWEEMKAEIEKICAYLSPLEYLGFDIVITEDGFRILEINTHQDLHKYPYYPQEVKDYFAGKLAQRKAK